jgi:PX domain-containing protein kinase-like protein
VVRSLATREDLLMSITFTDLKIDRNIFSDVLVGIRSHFVLPTVDAEYVEEKKMAVVFRRILKGSVRDVICNSKWNQSYARKYGRKGGEPLSEARIASWGRHVLEGINFLRLKGMKEKGEEKKNLIKYLQGLPAGHIHCGNLVVENNVCKITDYDNKLLTSLKPAHLALVQHEACAGLDPDVACFGAVLFEMATGFPMDTVDLAAAPRGLSPSVRAVLDAIFYSGARGPRPSLETLLAMPFFAGVAMPDLPPLARTRFGPKAKVGASGKEPM